MTQKRTDPARRGFWKQSDEQQLLEISKLLSDAASEALEGYPLTALGSANMAVKLLRQYINNVGQL